MYHSLRAGKFREGEPLGLPLERGNRGNYNILCLRVAIHGSRDQIEPDINIIERLVRRVLYPEIYRVHIEIPYLDRGDILDVWYPVTRIVGLGAFEIQPAPNDAMSTRIRIRQDVFIDLC